MLLGQSGMTNSSVGFPQFYQIQQILDRFLGLKNKLNDLHHEISNRTQKQLKAFAKQNPEIKQPDSEPDQSLKR
ncbi:hypothetical protein AZI09_12755 (plasmid) [Levilactobacillus brevis]|nr:hypothetical protein AZI09_12755 [Levilactobacillus brevis]